MTTTACHRQTDPWHSDSRVKANALHAAAAALREKHAASFMLAQRALNGEKLSPAERVAAGDAVTAVTAALEDSGPVNTALGYLLEAGVFAAKMRREREVEAPSVSSAPKLVRIVHFPPTAPQSAG